MATHDPSRLQSVFAAALDLPEDARAAYLERTCADDEALRTEVRELLVTDGKLSGMTARRAAPELARAAGWLAPAASLSGSRVGAFELRERLGRGGMGLVYRAERVDGAVAQEVAIKFVRRELLDADVARRFQLEQQLMARLNHPHIARLLDAAELPDGTPYYVMEFVAGVPVTNYCANQNLGVRERIGLLREVCAAVTEAHRELIVHRDLKPANILITTSGVPKLLDFGIAKPLAGPGTAGIDETGTAHRYFSPNYAAPEQVLGEPVGVACDVYALGLLVYEVLAGRRPFEFDGLSPGQVERLIVEVPPIPPSAALARDARSTRALRPQQLRGDLDGIVLRCLRKAASERYASVEQLESDLANYLEGRPVLARGGHAWYRVQKFVRRNAAAVLAGALTAVTLLVGIVGFAWQARIAQERAAELEQVSTFQRDMLSQVEAPQLGRLLAADVKAQFEATLARMSVPDAVRVDRVAGFATDWANVNATDAARSVIDHAILKPAAHAIPKQFANQPLVEAALSEALAERYTALGLYASALPLQERALSLRRAGLGDDHPDTIASILEMGRLEANLTTPAHAEPLYREALERSRRALGEGHRSTWAALNNLGWALGAQGRYDEAEPLLREALVKRRDHLGDDDRDTMTSMNNLGSILEYQGKFDQAEPLLRETLERRRRVLGSEADHTMSSMNNLGHLLIKQQRFVEAEAVFAETLALRRRVLGEDHPNTLTSVNNYADALLRNNKPVEAEQQFRMALDKRIRTFGRDHRLTLLTINNLAVVVQQQGRLEEAESYFRESLDGSRRLLGEDNLETLKAIEALGTILVLRGRHVDAIDLLSPAESTARVVFGSGSVRRMARFLLSLGKARAALGEYEAAEPNLLEAQRLFSQQPLARPDDAITSAEALSAFYAAWNAASPGKAHAAAAADWQRRLSEAKSAAPPSAAPR